jgi:hypothetical protein
VKKRLTLLIDDDMRIRMNRQDPCHQSWWDGLDYAIVESVEDIPDDTVHRILLTVGQPHDSTLTMTPESLCIALERHWPGWHFAGELLAPEEEG